MEVIVASAIEECTICLKVGELVSICAEDHKFCGECLGEYIKVQIESNLLPPVCPYNGCTKICKENELSELLSRNPQYLERMRLIMKKKDPEYSMCPSCKADNRGNIAKPSITCVSCNLVYCFIHNDSHPDITCEKFEKRRKEIDDQTMPKSIKNCPNCQSPSMRVSGCNGVRCPGCSCYWCFNCSVKCYGTTCPKCNASYQEGVGDGGLLANITCDCVLMSIILSPLLLLVALLFLLYTLVSAGCCCCWFPWVTFKIYENAKFALSSCLCRISCGMCFLTFYPCFMLGEFCHCGLYEHYPYEDDYDAIHIEKYIMRPKDQKCCIPCLPCVECCC